MRYLVGSLDAGPLRHKAGHNIGDIWFAYWPVEGYDPVIPVLQQSKAVDCLVTVVRFGILVAAFIALGP